MCLVEPRRVKNICEYNNLFFMLIIFFGALAMAKTLRWFYRQKKHWFLQPKREKIQICWNSLQSNFQWKSLLKARQSRQSTRQHDCPDLYSQNGGNAQSGTKEIWNYLFAKQSGNPGLTIIQVTGSKIFSQIVKISEMR